MHCIWVKLHIQLSLFLSEYQGDLPSEFSSYKLILRWVTVIFSDEKNDEGYKFSSIII